MSPVIVDKCLRFPNFLSFLTVSLFLYVSLNYFGCSFIFCCLLPNLRLSNSLPIHTSRSRPPCLTHFPFSVWSVTLPRHLLHPPLSKQQCLPLILHPFLSFVFLLRWQYIQGFCYLVFLTVTFLQDKTENKSGRKKKKKHS